MPLSSSFYWWEMVFRIYSCLFPVFQKQLLTVFAPRVEVFDGVVQADSDGGKAELSLQPSHQPVIQRCGPLGPDHGADGPKHPFVADASHCCLLSLNLGSHITHLSMKPDAHLGKRWICTIDLSLVDGDKGGRLAQSIVQTSTLCFQVEELEITISLCTSLKMNWRLFKYYNVTGTCSLTLAVSRGNVKMSATQAAAPALAIFTPRGGGTSEGLSPTMFPASERTDIHTHAM